MGFLNAFFENYWRTKKMFLKNVGGNNYFFKNVSLMYNRGPKGSFRKLIKIDGGVKFFVVNV
jgi:hypothetical protein